jgi:hypothetical protein
MRTTNRLEQNGLLMPLGQMPITAAAAPISSNGRVRAKEAGQRTTIYFENAKKAESAGTPKISQAPRTGKTFDQSFVARMISFFPAYNPVNYGEPIAVTLYPHWCRR